jgi:NAD(P)-dependent dehydrogenase (short-subunit alcohol dehydrogenase family)
MKRLEGKATLITGAAGGIGRAGALLFGQHGANLVLVDQLPQVEDTAQAVQAAGGRAVALTGDVSQEADVVAFIQATLRTYGRLDVCYANAGISGGFGAYDDLTADDWMRVLGVNLVGTFLAVKHAARVMVPARRGSIVCTTSVAALRSAGGPAPYSASKAGVISLVQTSALQFAGTGVRVNAVCPGLIEHTGMGQPVFDMARKYGIEEQFTGVIPLRRGGLPEEVAHAALFLASDEAAYVNGHVLTVDGGLSSSLPGVPVSSVPFPTRRGGS